MKGVINIRGVSFSVASVTVTQRKCANFLLDFMRQVRK